MCSSPRLGWRRNRYEEESNHGCIDDAGHDDLAGNYLSAGGYGAGAADFPGKGEWSVNYCGQQDRWLSNHRAGFFRTHIFSLAALIGGVRLSSWQFKRGTAWDYQPAS